MEDILDSETMMSAEATAAWNAALDAAALKVEEGCAADPRMHLIDELLYGKAAAIRSLKRSLPAAPLGRASRG